MKTHKTPCSNEGLCVQLDYEMKMGLTMIKYRFIAFLKKLRFYNKISTVKAQYINTYDCLSNIGLTY